MEASTSPTRKGWSDDVVPMLRLGLPLIGAQLAQLAINTTDVLIVGHLGTEDLAAIVLSTQYLFTILWFGSGLSVAVMPLAAQAVGQGKPRDVSRFVQMGLWASLAYAALVTPLFLACEPVLGLLGQKPEVASKAASYLRIAGLGVAPALIFMVLKAFLSALGRTQVIVFTNLFCVAFNALFAYVFALGHFGMPAFGLKGAAWVAVVVNGLFALILAIYVSREPVSRSYAIHHRLWRPDWPALMEVLRVGVPISFMILSEISLFSVASIMMGWIGALALAAHGIAMQLAALAFMIPLGLSQAATVRVGLAAGRGDRQAVRVAGLTALGMTAGFSLLSCTVFILSRTFLASLFISPSSPDGPDVLATAGLSLP